MGAKEDHQNKSWPPRDSNEGLNRNGLSQRPARRGTITATPLDVTPGSALLDMADTDTPAWTQPPREGTFNLFPHPDAPMHTSLLQRSLRINKAMTTFARFLDRRPAGLAAAEDGSLDIHQIWQHSEHQLNLGRQELLHEARLRGLWQMAFPSSQ